MTVEEGDHAVVQKIGRRDRRLAIIELGASNLGVGVDKGLLVDTPDPLQIANIERVLGAAVARMLALMFGRVCRAKRVIAPGRVVASSAITRPSPVPRKIFPSK